MVAEIEGVLRRRSRLGAGFRGAGWRERMDL
jgi:hypothetical protein